MPGFTSEAQIRVGHDGPLVNALHRDVERHWADREPQPASERPQRLESFTKILEAAARATVRDAKVGGVDL